MNNNTNTTTNNTNQIVVLTIFCLVYEIEDNYYFKLDSNIQDKLRETLTEICLNHKKEMDAKCTNKSIKQAIIDLDISDTGEIATISDDFLIDILIDKLHLAIHSEVVTLK